MTDPPQRFLMVRLSSIGDIVHALPAAGALAETFPQAQIHWAVEKRHEVLLEGNPHLHQIIALDTLGWRKRLHSRTTWQEIFDGVRDLRAATYRAALDFQGLWKSALVAGLSRSRERLGFAEPWLREPGAASLYTERVSLRRRMHVVEENLALVGRLGAHTKSWQFPLPWNDVDDDYVDTQLAALDCARFTIVHPGGGWPAKCWPPQNYAALIRRLGSLRSERILLTGSPAEEPVIREILLHAGSKQAHYFPATLVQFIALAKHARLFIGGDTGPLHLAAAVRTPIVGIYGPTDPVRNGPFCADDITLYNFGPIDHSRRGSKDEYLPGISVDSVVEAVERRLAGVHE